MTANDEPTALYRLYDGDGELLYVGISNDPERRFAEHAADKHWWWDVDRRRIEWFDSRASALAAEEMAIKVKDPRHNYEHSRYRPFIRLTLELNEADAVGLDVLASLTLPVQVRTREQAIQGIIGRELASRGLYGDVRCFHHGGGWPEGVDVRPAREGVCPCGGAILPNGTYPKDEPEDAPRAVGVTAEGIAVWDAAKAHEGDTAVTPAEGTVTVSADE